VDATSADLIPAKPVDTSYPSPNVYWNVRESRDASSALPYLSHVEHISAMGDMPVVDEVTRET
jgi:hypothetical protein